MSNGELYFCADGPQGYRPGRMLAQELKDWRAAKRVLFQPQEAVKQLAGVPAASPPGPLEQGKSCHC